jgi:hypothetical protein
MAQHAAVGARPTPPTPPGALQLAPPQQGAAATDLADATRRGGARAAAASVWLERAELLVSQVPSTSVWRNPRLRGKLQFAVVGATGQLLDGHCGCFAAAPLPGLCLHQQSPPGRCLPGSTVTRGVLLSMHLYLRPAKYRTFPRPIALCR